MTPLTLRIILLLLVCAWSVSLSVYDLKWRILPNWLTLGGAAVALVGRLGFGWASFLDGFAAAAVAGAFLLVPFLMRGAGGGDVKMLFAAGAMVGWSGVLPLLWFTSLAGLAMGAVMLASGHLDGARLRHFLRCALDWRYDRKAGAAALPPKESARFRIPFSVPIAVGLAVALAG